ncbi:MAG: hypothetical protein N2593_01120 [Patescibacteria group bacterium]|nr:hypothetical protein [Patescibacteria group bacterium]
MNLFEILIYINKISLILFFIIIIFLIYQFYLFRKEIYFKIKKFKIPDFNENISNKINYTSLSDKNNKIINSYSVEDKKINIFFYGLILILIIFFAFLFFNFKINQKKELNSNNINNNSFNKKNEIIKNLYLSPILTPSLRETILISPSLFISLLEKNNEIITPTITILNNKIISPTKIIQLPTSGITNKSLIIFFSSFLLIFLSLII